MEVVALVGPSGTGKSHRASLVAEEYGCEAILDDGLLIAAGKILAGRSAKKARNKIEAIRRAILEDEGQRAQIREALERLAPGRLLVLGTSEPMVERIAERLGLPPPRRVVRIEDVANPHQIEHARRDREQRGRHVIPAPAVEVRKTFSGYLVDPLRFVARAKNRARMVDKAVVRPTWTMLGRFTVDDTVVAAIAAHAAEEVTGVHAVRRVSVDSWAEGVNLTVELALAYGVVIPEALRRVRERVRAVVEDMTALNVLAVEAVARRVVVADEAEADESRR